MKVPGFSLANGVDIPAVGLGMDQVRDPREATAAVEHALAFGYRSIDTASAYGNERDVGEGIRVSGVSREDIFVSTKVDGPDHGYDRTLFAFEGMLQRFGFDYIDMYLIHWPGKYLYPETWRALERLYADGRAKAIGVCNFNVRHLERLRDSCSVLPMVDQIEWHPYFQQVAVAEYCSDAGILVEAWSPLMCGGIALEDAVIVAMSRRLNRSPAQVILRWHYQGKRRVFPKSVNFSRIEENVSIFDFELTDADMAQIDGLGAHDLRIGPDPDIFFLK